METADFLIIYPWITKDFFKNILQKMQINNYISVEHFSLRPALAKGENYGSQMIRANITYYINNNNLKHEHICLLIKTELPQNAKIESELNLLLKEITIYKTFLPRMYELLREINDDTNFSPICLDCGLNPSYMVLEDLTLSGYQNIDRKSGLNYEHFKILLTKVAKWHATSSVIGIKNPELLKYHTKPLLNAEYSTDFQILLKNCISTCHQIVSGWPGYEKISEKLIVLQKTFINKCCDVFSSDVNDFNVLNHGDLWSNNLLFKLNENEEILDVIMVDYSIGFWGLPGIDLTYTFFTSSNIAYVQENEWDDLTHHYYSVLIKTLKDLNYPKKMPTLIDINVAILRKGIYSVIMSMLMIGARKLKEENVDISLFTGETAKDQELREKILNDPSCKPVLKYVIDYCNRKGFFD